MDPMMAIPARTKPATVEISIIHPTKRSCISELSEFLKET